MSTRHIMFDVDGKLVRSCGFDGECFVRAVEEVPGQRPDGDWDRRQACGGPG